MLNKMINTIVENGHFEEYLEEYIEDFRRLAPHMIRNEKNYEIFIKRCKDESTYYFDGKEKVLETANELYLIDFNFFVENNIKFMFAPTVMHFYDFRKYPVYCKTFKGEVTDDILKEYAYLFSVTNTSVRGILKSEIAQLESTGDSNLLIKNPESEIVYSEQGFSS